MVASVVVRFRFAIFLSFLITETLAVYSHPILQLPTLFLSCQLYCSVSIFIPCEQFSRYVVGWLIAEREAAWLAEALIQETCAKQGVTPGQLTLHADRGSSMRSKPVALLLADLGVTKTHSRPYTSNDNPYSEAHFKTLKYRPDFPERFGSLADARAWAQPFFLWYNNQHYHTGLSLMTPAMVHYGLVETVRDQRQRVLHSAYTAHPERFVKGVPIVSQPPCQVWINPPVVAPFSLSADPVR